MRIAVATIGNELLNGDLVDTNTARLGAWLRRMGLGVQESRSVPDEVDAIARVLGDLAGRHELVLVTGGLGPTEDDLTLSAAAHFAGVPLVEDAATGTRLRARFKARGVPFTDNNLRQAMVPSGAVIHDNPVGTAPCVQLAASGATLFFFPGVPRELAQLMEDVLRPWLSGHARLRPYRSAMFRTFGRTESQVATLLEGLPRDPRLHVAYRAHFPEIQVTLHVNEPDEAAATALLGAARAAVRGALGTIVYSEDAAVGFAAAVGEALTHADATLAVAESCTGGLISKLCTDVAGSSAWFSEGAVTYSNAAKTRQLGVDPALIETHGAVSEAVACAMARGIRDVTGATYGVAVTGVAGPGGGTRDKPVGTVHLALAGPAGIRPTMRRWPFDRDRNRVVSAFSALDMVRRALLAR